MRLQRLDDYLREKLRDPEYAAAYLKVSLEDGDIGEFLWALREVAGAQQGGVSRVAADAGLGRESLYRSLARGGNPGIRTVNRLLRSVGLGLSVTVRPEADAAETNVTPG